MLCAHHTGVAATLASGAGSRGMQDLLRACGAGDLVAINTAERGLLGVKVHANTLPDSANQSSVMQGKNTGRLSLHGSREAWFLNTHGIPYTFLSTPRVF